jgi:hypothetical protein
MSCRPLLFLSGLWQTVAAASAFKSPWPPIGLSNHLVLPGKRSTRAMRGPFA